MTTTAPVYDAFTGPELDATHWFYLEYPQPDGPAWVCTEPSARLTTADGKFRVEVDEFERGNAVQVIDNCKFVVLSTETFDVPSAGTLRIDADLAATSIAASGDYRDGFASLIAIEPETGLVFDIAATSDEVVAIHELLPISDTVTPFTRIVDAPLAKVETAAGATNHATIEFDAARRAVSWSVDGELIFDAKDVQMPQQLRVGMGIFTLHPVGDGTSRSLRGQGLHATWSGVTVTSQP